MIYRHIRNTVVLGLFVSTIGLTLAMQRSPSAACLRQVDNQSPFTVFLSYNTEQGRTTCQIPAQGTWHGFVPIHSDDINVALLEPISRNVRLVRQVAHQASPVRVPRAKRRALSALDLSYLTGIQVVENYVINYPTWTVESPDGIKLTVQSSAFNFGRGRYESGIGIEPFVQPRE